LRQAESALTKRMRFLSGSGTNKKKMLLYRLEFDVQKLKVRIEEAGSKRILYLDTLKLLAKEEDKLPLHFLTKIHLRSSNVSRDASLVSFQVVEVGLEQSLEALKLLAKTGRIYHKTTKLQAEFSQMAKIYWRGDDSGLFSPVIQWKGQEFPLESSDALFPSWGLLQGTLFSFESKVSWRWIEPFLKGPLLLTGAQKKKFLDEEPPILWKEKPQEKAIEVLPELVLSDTTGCFANLRMDYVGISRVAFDDFSPLVLGRARLKKVEEAWEKDLLESGFIRKTVGSSHYYCMGDKVLDTIGFLLDLEWKIYSFEGKRIFKQTSASWDIREEKGQIALRGKVHFGHLESPLKAALQAKGVWVELDQNSIGLLDRKKFSELQGEWEEDVLRFKKSALKAVVSSFNGDPIQWESKLLQMVQGLQEGASLQTALPGPLFRGNLLPYQQKGVDFLAFLQTWGFSGLLADEMGLGKTVQVLAFFSRLRTNLPILVIAPSSLLYQWKLEILKFLPHANVSLYTGQNRKETHFQGIVITSYAIL
jgi:hypothetical protein